MQKINASQILAEILCRDDILADSEAYRRFSDMGRGDIYVPRDFGASFTFIGE